MTKASVEGYTKALGPNDFGITQRDSLYQGFSTFDNLTINHKRFLGGEQSVSRELLVRYDAVAILLFDPCLDRVVLVEQFRVGALSDPSGPWMLELVAGLIDSEEPPEQVAKRECFEEAGCHVSRLEPISEFYLSPGVSNEKVHLYLACVDASDLKGVHGLASEGEDIKVHVVSSSKAMDLLSCGLINNAITQIGLQWLQINKDRLLSEFNAGSISSESPKYGRVEN